MLSPFYPKLSTDISGHSLDIAACPAFVLTLYSTSKAFQSAFSLWCLYGCKPFSFLIFCVYIFFDVKYSELRQVSFCKLKVHSCPGLTSVSETVLWYERGRTILTTRDNDNVYIKWEIEFSFIHFWSAIAQLTCLKLKYFLLNILDNEPT